MTYSTTPLDQQFAELQAAESFIGEFLGLGSKATAPEDQYQPTRPMYVEEIQEQEPDPEELPDQDWAAQKTEYEL